MKDDVLEAAANTKYACMDSDIQKVIEEKKGIHW